MPILFEELENILLNWKSNTLKNSSNSNIANIILDGIRDKNKEIYIKKIKNLFDSISVKDLEIKEVLNPDRTYGKLTVTQEIVIKKKSSL